MADSINVERPNSFNLAGPNSNDFGFLMGVASSVGGTGSAT